MTSPASAPPSPVLELVESDGEDGEENGGVQKPLKGESGGKEADRATQLRANARRRANAFRALAKQAGSLQTEGPQHSTSCLVTVSDAKRLSTYIPATSGAVTYEPSEFAERVQLFEKGISSSACSETQIRADAILNWAVTSALRRVVDSQRTSSSISPSDMEAVLRPFQKRTMFTSVQPPPGLVRYGQELGILSVSAEQQDDRRREKRRAAKNHKVWTETAARMEARRSDARERRERARQSRRAVEPVA